LCPEQKKPLKTRSKYLADQILKHKALYYAGNPAISDAEYDQLEDELSQLAPDHPVLFIVGTSTPEGTLSHNPPMLSIQKATGGISDILRWLGNSPSKQLVVSYKVDGLSLSLIYEDGHFKQASTRGDGLKGEDVTFNVMKIESIPKIIPISDRVNVRGELYMQISEFKRLQIELEKEYTSPRNLAVGSLKQKDLNETAKRRLNFFAFDILGFNQDNEEYSAHLDTLKSWGFDSPIIETMKKPTEEKISTIFDQISVDRPNLDFEIDGIIFRYNNIVEYDKVGVTEHHPRGQIALKFASAEAITTLNSITWQVGRTGVLTPVAELQPVTLSGAKISRATLHNADFVENENIANGDKLVLQRSGDVIPKIVKVSVKSANKYSFPTTCPSCSSQITRSGVNLLCPNSNCPDREIQIIRHFIRQVDIKFLGIKAIERLYQNNIVKQPTDLYTVSKEKLKFHLGKNGEKAFDQIQANKTLTLDVFLSGLGIHTLGKRMGKVLSSHFKTLEALQKSSVEEFCQLEGISTITAEAIHKGLKDPNLIPRFIENGVVIKSKEILKVKSTIGQGLRVYVTGSIENMTKKEIQQFVEENGFIWSKSITKKLDILVKGYKAGLTKIEKAEKLGISIKSWEEFLTEINTNKSKEINVSDVKPVQLPKKINNDGKSKTKSDLSKFF
jgi:DNA ligase (NAD+)